MLKFLSLEPEVFGVDINDLSLRIVKLRKNSRGFRLVSVNEVSLASGVVKGGVIQDENSLIERLKFACQTVRGEKLNTKYAVVSLPEEKAFFALKLLPARRILSCRIYLGGVSVLARSPEAGGGGKTAPRISERSGALRATSVAK